MKEFNTASSRILGLDIARTIAILFVLCAHTLLFSLAIWGNVSLQFMSVCTVLGVLGVELFFTLSGFLIGGLLFRDVYAPSLRKTGIFFLRRWFRTLPAYYFVLLVLVGFNFLNLNGLPDNIWQYFFFLQNYNQGASEFFPVSWTLSIEQWTYILAPIVFFLLPRLFHKLKILPQRYATLKYELLFSLLLVFAFFLFWRMATVWLSASTWDTDIRKQIHLRLDAIFFGAGIVYCKKFFPQLYSILGKCVFFVAALLGIGLFSWQLGVDDISSLDSSFFQRTIGFSVCDLLMATLLPFFDQSPFLNSRLAPCVPVRNFFTWMSTHAYSLYLVHFSFYWLAFWSVDKLESSWVRLLAGGVASAAALGATFITSTLLYRHIEKPGMDLRRFLP